MCGIVGALSFNGMENKELEKVRREAVIFLTTELLYMTHSRGKDATGLAALFADGNFAGLKMAVPSPEFISRFGNKDTDYDGFMKIIRKARSPLKTIIGHCRKTSIGNADDNVNNHPIKVGNIVGIHNGTLTNHDKIFEKLKCGRDGEVDSEAIIRLVDFMTKGGKEPFTAEMVKEVCMRLQGTYSCLIFNGNSPNQVAFFRDTKPGEIALIRPLKLALIASEKDFLKETLIKFNNASKLYPMTVKLPYLTKDDVVLKTMPDDSAAVFDLSKDIVGNTEPEALFTGAKVPRAGKLWRSSSTKGSNYYTNNRTNHTGFGVQNRKKTSTRQTGAGAGIGNRKATVVNAQSRSTQGGDDDSEGLGQAGSSQGNGSEASGRKGRVWDKDTAGFVNADGVTETKKIGGVQIDIASGKITEVYGGKDVEKEPVLELSDDDIEVIEPKEEKDLDPAHIGMEIVDEDKINTLFGDPASLEEPEFPDDQGNDKRTQLLDHLKSTATKVEVGLNPIALEAAGEAAKLIDKYEDEEDLLSDLEISDGSIFKNAPLHALANRISTHLYKRAFYDGFVACSATDKGGANLTEKKARAEQNIQVLKKMTLIFSRAVGNSSGIYATRKNLIEEAVTKEFNRGNLLTADDIERLFSTGDFRDYPELRQAKITVLSKENRERDTKGD